MPSRPLTEHGEGRQAGRSCPSPSASGGALTGSMRDTISARSVKDVVGQVTFCNTEKLKVCQQMYTVMYPENPNKLRLYKNDIEQTKLQTHKFSTAAPSLLISEKSCKQLS